MGTGFLNIQLYVGDYALHGDSTTVLVKRNGELLHTLHSDENGKTETVPIDGLPNLEEHDGLDLSGELFSTVDVEVPEAQGYKAVKIFGVQAFDGITSNLNIHLEPIAPGESSDTIEIHVPREHGVDIDRNISAPENHEPGQGGGSSAGEPMPPPPSMDPAAYAEQALETFGTDPAALISPQNVPLANQVVIPDFITVHLGTPSAAARNVRVPFKEYIKNVVSSEIYPFWDRAAIEANTHAIVSFTLNRLFTKIRRCG